MTALYDHEFTFSDFHITYASTLNNNDEFCA